MMYVKGVPLTIVGVAADGFEGVEPGHSTDFWIPLQNRAELNAWGSTSDDGTTYMQQPKWWCLRMLARLAPGMSREQPQNDCRELSGRRLMLDWEVRWRERSHQC
jgi:hypothetical protein